MKFLILTLKSLLVTVGASFIASHASANLVTHIPQVGPHYALFNVEKNVNPQNIMVVYSKLDQDCRFLKDNYGPQFDFYWLMDRASYKKVNSIIKSEIRKRLEVEPWIDTNEFSVILRDLEQVDMDIAEPKVTVRSKGYAGKCQVSSQITLGPSDKNRTIRLTSIYTEGTQSLSPRILSVTLNGVDIKTGKKVTRRYLGK